ncbi:hypothetical protein [Lewinella sp. LCG006]|uniref:hypothetical protein n=1 Tax=Lewinella sp. LCG006 TaxID=3231911 RepID=UPI00345F9A9B
MSSWKILLVTMIIQFPLHAQVGKIDICGKLDVREAGYMSDFDIVYNLISHYGLYEKNITYFEKRILYQSSRENVFCKRSTDERFFYYNKWYDYRQTANVEQIYDYFRTIIAPPGFDGLHIEALDFLRIARDYERTSKTLNQAYQKLGFWDKLTGTTETNELSARVGELFENRKSKRYSLLNSIEKKINEIEQRTREVNYEGAVFYVKYTLPGIPIEIAVSENWDIEVRGSGSISSPYGDIAFESKTTAGVKKIIIESNGKRESILLDRPFKIFIPTDFGFNIIYESEDYLLIQVLKRS